MQKIKNIIFDLGGVFIDIDYLETEKAFEKLGIKNFKQHFTQHNASSLFIDLETGRLTNDTFFNAFREITGVLLSDNDICYAWNAMLGAFPKERLDWLINISQNYKIFLFSNTNSIHYDGFLKIFQESTGEETFDTFFKKAYYSHQIGLRKPDTLSFEKIIELEKLNAEETLFIDDTPINIKGAQKAGLKTILLQKPQTIFDLEL